MEDFRKFFRNVFKRVARKFGSYCERHGGRGTGLNCPGCTDMKILTKNEGNLIQEDPNKTVEQRPNLDFIIETIAPCVSESGVHASTYRVVMRSYKPDTRNYENRRVQLTEVPLTDEESIPEN